MNMIETTRSGALATNRSQTRPRERGQMLIIFALTLMVMVAMVGLLIDGGMAWGNERQGQTAADTAALYAARAFSTQASGTPVATRIAAARTAAGVIATRNGFPVNLVDCTGATIPNGGVVVNSPPLRANDPLHATANYIEVITTRRMNTTFSAAVGQGCWLVSSHAIASVVPQGPVPITYPAILAGLGPNPCDVKAFENSGDDITIIGDMISNSGMWGSGWDGWTVTGTSTRMANPPNTCGSADSGPPGTTTVNTVTAFPVTYTYCYPGAPAADCVGHATWSITNNNTGVEMPCTYTSVVRGFTWSGPGIYCTGTLGSGLSGLPFTQGVLTDVAFGGGTWVMGGQAGKLASSTNGIDWTVQSYPFATDINGVAYNGSNRWVAVGAGGKLATSNNGTTWAAVTPIPSFTTDLYDVAHNGIDRWIAVGAGGKLATSTDGTTWAAVTPIPSFTTALNDVAYNGIDRWIAVGVGGKIATSTNGTTWTLVTPLPFTSDLNSVAYNGTDRWIAVGKAGKISTSTNGTTWTAVTPVPFADDLFSVDYGAGRWVAVGEDGKTATSTNGTTWTAVTPTPSTLDLNGIAHNGSNLWVTVGLESKLATSPDGLAWTSRSSDLSYARMTLVSAGNITIGASQFKLRPYWDKLAVFSTRGGASVEAIALSGQDADWSGLMYAPKGLVHTAGGEGLTIGGAVWGQTIKWSGQSITLDSTGLSATGSTPADYKTGNLVE